MAQNVVIASNSTNSVASPNTPKMTAANRLLVLKQKRLELEKRLQDRNNLLNEMCKREAQILGVSYPPAAATKVSTTVLPLNDDTAALSSKQQTNNQLNTQSLPRRIGTSFTLSEKYLNRRTPSANSPLNGGSGKDEEEMNSLLLQRDIQQQICKASLKLLNDTTLTKSIRRKHKQSYELAQQKLMAISQGLTVKKKQEIDPSTSKTLPISVKTNFNKQSFPQPPHSAEMVPGIMKVHGMGESSSPNSTAYYDRNSYMPPGTSLYRSTSSSSSLGNSSNPALGKSSLSLDANHQLLHHHHFQQAPVNSYESKSLHNFVMGSGTSGQNTIEPPPPRIPQQYNQHHQQSLMLPPNQYPVTSSNYHLPHPSSSRQYHPPPNQVVSPQQAATVIHPQIGLGGYWMLNENNEKVWCTSASSYVQEQIPTTRYASLDRKAAIYIPHSQHHLKSKMPSPRYEYTNNNSHEISSPNPAVAGSFSMPTKSTSLGNFEFLVTTTEQHHHQLHLPTEDSQSINSFNSDSNNNNTNQHMNYGKSPNAAPPLRPKSQPKQVALDDKSGWYETALDAVQPSHSSKPKVYHKPQPPLPSNVEQQQLHSRPTPSTAQGNLHVEIPSQQTMLERSHSHRVPGTTFVGSSHSPRSVYQQQQDAQHFSPLGHVVKRSASSAVPNTYPQSSPQLLPNSANSPGVDSPKNMTVVQQGKFQPYKEESKPFEMSDFYKYSTKFRNQKQTSTLLSPLSPADSANNNSFVAYHNNQIQEDNVNNNGGSIQKSIYQPNPSICQGYQ